jgi:multiple sugar transport system permease protein
MPRSKRRSRERLGQALVHLILVLAGLVFVVPFVWMFLSSFKPALEIIRIPPTFIPEKFTLDNYRTILHRLQFWRYFMNSIVVSIAITAVAMVTSGLAGFVFSKFDFPGRNFLFYFCLAGLMIPFAVVVLPMYLFVAKVGLQNKYLGLIIPFCISPFGIFMVRQFMEGIPMEMIEAARIDGASNLWIFFKVMFPLSTASIGGVGVFTFLWTWNQLWWPFIVISKKNMWTLPLAIAALTFQHAKRYDMIVTGSSLAVLPVMIVFALAQRKLVRGVTLTGMKM